MISTTLLTIAILASVGGSDVVTADELAHHRGHLIHLQGRTGDRIGNQLQIAGHEEMVTVPEGVKIPRRGSKDRPYLLDIWLLQQQQGLTITRATPVSSWQQCLEYHQSRIATATASDQESILRFLLREAPLNGRTQLWLSLEQVAGDPARWIRLGGQFLSGTDVLSETIHRLSLQSVALQQQLYQQEGLWLSKLDFYRLNQLTEVDGHAVVTTRHSLEQTTAGKLEQILMLSKKQTLAKDIRPGARRRTVLALHGNPGDVTWIQLEGHFIEQWTYTDYVMRIIDGRVFEVVITDHQQ
jgi:hypothetical protein